MNAPISKGRNQKESPKQVQNIKHKGLSISFFNPMLCPPDPVEQESCLPDNWVVPVPRALLGAAHAAALTDWSWAPAALPGSSHMPVVRAVLGSGGQCQPHVSTGRCPSRGSLPGSHACSTRCPPSFKTQVEGATPPELWEALSHSFGWRSSGLMKPRQYPPLKKRRQRRRSLNSLPSLRSVPVGSFPAEVVER